MKLRVINFVLLIILLTVATLKASDGVLVITKAGYYFLDQNDQGVPILTSLATIVPPVTITQVLKLDNIAPPPLPDPTDRLSVHRKAVQAATTKVVDPNKANTLVALAKLYRTTSGLPVVDRNQLIQATDVIFAAMNLPNAWITWKKEVDQSTAGFSALDDAKKAWQVIAEVLEGK
jgi:hypothetical protein